MPLGGVFVGFVSFTPEQMYNQQTLREMLDPEGAVAPVSEVMASAKDVQDAMNAMEVSTHNTTTLPGLTTPPPYQGSQHPATTPSSVVQASTPQLTSMVMCMWWPQDEADLEAMRGAQKENIEEMREFDDVSTAHGGFGPGLEVIG